MVIILQMFQILVMTGFNFNILFNLETNPVKIKKRKYAHPCVCVCCVVQSVYFVSLYKMVRS